MKKELERLKKRRAVASFLFPTMPFPVQGKIASLSATKVVIEADHGGEVFQYATHPNSVVLVTKKP